MVTRRESPGDRVIDVSWDHQWMEADSPGKSLSSPGLLPGLPVGHTPWKLSSEAHLMWSIHVSPLGQKAGQRRVENGAGAKQKPPGKGPRFPFWFLHWA